MKTNTTPLARFAATALAFGLASAALAADIGISAMADYWNTRHFDAVDDGFGGLTARIEAEFLPFVGIEARFNAFGASDEWDVYNRDTGWVGYDFDAEVVSIEAGLVLNIPLGPLSLYGGGGVGAYFPDGQLDVRDHGWKRRVDLDFDTEAGAYAFGGLEVSLLPNLAIIGEVRYTWLESEVEADWHGTPLLQNEKVDFDGVGIGVGLILWL